MNPEIQNKLLEVITSAQRVGGDVYEYVQREAPKLAEEVVVSAGIDASGMIILCGIGIAVSVVVARWCKKSWDADGAKDCYADAPGYVMGIVLSILLAGVCASRGADSIQTVIKCKYAPRIVFIQEISKLLK